MAVFAALGSVQFDPLEVAGRNHDLVLLARIAGYRREMTDALLYEERRLFEAYNKGLSLLPTDQLPWHRITWDEERMRHEGTTFIAHAALVDELIGRIRAEGPLSSLDFEQRGQIEWYWRPTNAVRAILEALGEAGILAFANRRGNRRYYDLAERLFPADMLARRPDAAEQRRHRLLSRYRAHGLLGGTGSAELWHGTAPATRSAAYDGPTRAELLAGLVVDGTLVPVAVHGVRGERFVLSHELALLDAAERDAVAAGQADGWTPIDPDSAGVAMLAPLDPLVWDREFLRALYGFDYRWEVYIPERKRTWGYYVLPLLWGDRLVGRIEPRIDRAADAVRILGFHWEADFDPLARPEFMRGLAEAMEAHRAFAGVERILVPRTVAAAGIRTALQPYLPALGRPSRRRSRVSVRPIPADRGTIRRTT